MSDSADADTINDAIGGSKAPRMAASLTTTIDLLRGVMETTEGDPVWHSIAEVRELTGADEEALGKLDKKKELTYDEYTAAILKMAVLNIGDIDIQATPEALDKLILADRDILFLGLVRATYGVNKNVRTMCRECSTSNDVVIELDKDFEVVQPDFDIKEPIVVDTHKGTFNLRLPNNEDIREAGKENTPAETNTLILSRCLVWKVSGPQDPIEFVKNLNTGVRRKLLDALVVDIGPKLQEVDTQCAECGEEMPLLLDWVSLLFS